MSPRLLFHKLLNCACAADITRVLWFDTRKPVYSPGYRCRLLDAQDLQQLSSSGHFHISSSFVQDYQSAGFTCVGCEIDQQIVGLCCLMAGGIAARHNSGGTAFQGIAMALPPGVYYLFKVEVRNAYRGQRVVAAMIEFAVKHVAPDRMRAIVTTTNWTNEAFLRSVLRLGFRAVAYASEYRVGGWGIYQLPPAIDAATGNRLPRRWFHRCVKHNRDNEDDGIRLYRESSA